MSDSYELENNAIDGEDRMGSLYHSGAQAKLSWLLYKSDKKFFVATELSLDISQHDLSGYHLEAKSELKPDVCAYLKSPVVPDKEDDLLVVSQMPDLAIEILSPRQSVSYLIRKIKAYFELGVRSCWLVEAARQIVTVYSGVNQYKTFNADTELIDPIMDIRLPIQEIFAK